MPAAQAEVPADSAAAVDDSFYSTADFPASTETLVPSGARARARANIAAIETLHRVRTADRPATAAEQRVLAAWSGWGAVPEVFDARDETLAGERDRLRTLLTRDEYTRAEASVLNAHYTDPAIVAAVWDAVRRAGFCGGRVLEPGCGSGTFIGHAPAEAVMVGVENDPLTAGIAAALYPSAQIRNEGFETTRVPENSFTATVGNVPFGRYVVYDPAHNPARHSIHNHFIIKALALTAPGGYVAVLSSRYTLDSASDRARREMAARAELVGALRLPSRAFSRVAGTQVVTDLLMFRARDPEHAAVDEHPTWLDTTTTVLADPATGATDELTINAYYLENPDNVLGTPQLGRGLHGSPTLVVVGATGAQLAGQLADRLADLIDTAVARGHGLTATAETLTVVSEHSFDAGLITADRGPQTPLYTLRYNDATNIVQYWAGHDWQPQNTPKTLLAETRQLIELRDLATSLITSQRDGRPQSERDQLRGHLNYLYDSYVRRHGPINRFTWVHPKEPTQERHDARVAEFEARWREHEGEPGARYRGPVPDGLAEQWDAAAWETPAPYKKRRHLDGGIRHDSGWAIVSALEIFDDDTGTAVKAPIFSTDLLSAAVIRTSADSPEEALAMSLDRAHRVDMEMIAALLGVGADDARALLAGLVYPSLDDPDELIPAATALSGNVRQKLAAATEAAHHNPVYNDYVTALRDVQPPDRTAEQIKARPGAPWVPATLVAQFAHETFDLTGVSAEHVGGRWVVEVESYKRHGRLMTEDYGLARRGCDAVSLLEALCNSRAVVVNDDKGVLDTQATFAAQAKCAKITEEFQRWLFADEDRRDMLVAEYNRRFNSLRAPRYDGSHLRLPGLSDHFVPHFYQRNAVARIINEPTVLLDHVVGAGKTGSMVMGAMELRRLGLVRQPWIVVPNHIIEQVGREAQQWYPAARILVGSAATTADGRRRLVAQSAASQWDMVIVGQSAFTAIAVSDDVRIDYISEQVDNLREQLAQAQTARTKKRIELAIKSTVERLERLTAQQSKDTGLRFEQTGADYLYVDITDRTKNPYTPFVLRDFGDVPWLFTDRVRDVRHVGRRRRCGTTSGDRRAAGATDRPQRWAAVVDDRVAGRDRAFRGRPVPARA